MATDNPHEEFVYIRLGAGDSDADPARVSRAAYDQIWKGKGFVLVDEDEAALALSPETQAEVAAGEPATTRKKG